MPYNTKLAIPIIVVAIVGILVAASYYSYTMMSQYYSQPSMMMGEEQGQLTIDDSLKAAQDYIEYTGVPDLAVAEIMEFSNHFYVDVYEEDTGIHAFELIIEKDGDAYPEHGPNMMWNTKYGHHGGGMMGTSPESTQMSIDEDGSIIYAQNYLDEYMPGAEATEPHRFYGYYTLHVEKDGNIIGMLSVDGFSGDVWYHNWHGDFVQILELEHHEE
ncbi:MAG: hypothetical protein NWF08_09195 [Candidatus Bathyarchaeota archaeon]|nr:hypothetical protein [Candidatus Bathyarchaeota archaeon]